MGNLSSSSSEIKDWEPLRDYIHAHESIWLSHVQSKQILESLKYKKHQNDEFYYVINPFNGTLSVERANEGYCCYPYSCARDTLQDNIPFIDYPINTTLISSEMPPGIRIARQDLWNSKLFNNWLSCIKDKNLFTENRLNRNVTDIVKGYGSL